jgi:hypothetical protein
LRAVSNGRYEKKLAEHTSDGIKGEASGEELKREAARLRDVAQERLAEVEHWKREYCELSAYFQHPTNNPMFKQLVQREVAEVAAQFRLEIAALEKAKQSLTEENERLRVKTSRGHNQSQQSIEDFENEKLIKDYKRVVRNMKFENDEQKSELEQFKRERKDLITKELHFEKLKEQELKLVESLKIDSNANFRRVSELEKYITTLSSENEQLAQVVRELNNREKERKEISESSVRAKVEKEAKYRLECLEEKINELIEENETLMNENEHLKSGIKSSQNLDFFSKVSTSTKEKSSTEMEQKIRELETRLREKEQVVERVRIEAETRVNKVV